MKKIDDVIQKFWWDARTGHRGGGWEEKGSALTPTQLLARAANKCFSSADMFFDTQSSPPTSKPSTLSTTRRSAARPPHLRAPRPLPRNASARTFDSLKRDANAVRQLPHQAAPEPVPAQSPVLHHRNTVGSGELQCRPDSNHLFPPIPRLPVYPFRSLM